MPFYAEYLYQSLRSSDDPESVHLASWPMSRTIDVEVLRLMQATRSAVGMGLEARAREGIKVRQPLSSLSLKGETLQGKDDYLALIKDEVNVKHVLFNPTQEGEALIDTTLTEGLRREGCLRELIRAVQEERKRQNLKPTDSIELSLVASAEGRSILKEFNTTLRRAVGAARIDLRDSLERATSSGVDFQFTVTRA
jgi:isoleucyl-tRNA synthetase